VHDDWYYLAHAIRSFEAAGQVLVCVSRQPWGGGSPGDWEITARVAEEAGATVFYCDEAGESAHRRYALADVKRRVGGGFLFIPDGDEIIEARLLQDCRTIAENRLAERVYVHMDTYFKDASRVVRPRERITPLIMIDLDQVEHEHIRNYSGGRPLTLSPAHGVLHHLSWAGPDARALRKLETSSHRDEMLDGWFQRVWRGYDLDVTIQRVHPTEPGAYGWIERIPVPKPLRGIETPVYEPLEPGPNWPRIWAVVPQYCGASENTIPLLRAMWEMRDLYARHRSRRRLQP
jgi:hypothetical protein